MTGNATTVKCLVWDLDNTLWNGTLSEGDHVEPAAGVRETIAALDARGILQSVASKNDHGPAFARLEELDLAELFVLPQIGWGAKSGAVRRIAERLNFAHGTIAFIDDQPAERAEVTFHLPDVRCYPAEQVATLADLPEFRPTTHTADSRRRRLLYQAGFRRDAERADFPGPDEDFLRSLSLEMTIDRADEDDLARVAELTVRTTQMNATGVHYAEPALRDLLADEHHDVLTVGLSDRFGPHGAIGIVLVERHHAVWHLKLLATSCRVVSLGVGSTLLSWLADRAARAGVHVIADFRPTGRNRMMEIAYRFAGFTDRPCPCAAACEEPAGPDRPQRLHLLPARGPISPIIEIASIALGGDDRG
ncbi:HAD-IIIC family phosphatase [Saccharopolyspora sp. NPDC002578]